MFSQLPRLRSGCEPASRRLFDAPRFDRLGSRIVPERTELVGIEIVLAPALPSDGDGSGRRPRLPAAHLVSEVQGGALRSVRWSMCLQAAASARRRPSADSGSRFTCTRCHSVVQPDPVKASIISAPHVLDQLLGSLIETHWVGHSGSRS